MKTAGNRLKRIALLVIGLQAMGVLSMAQQSTTVQSFLYYWIPRTKDVPKDLSAPDSVLLKYLVEHSAEEEYTVAPEDQFGLDDITRKHFLVSQGDYPNAYAIYLKNILDRNSGLTLQTVLVPKRTKIKLPSGPKFAAIQLASIDLKSYYAEANKAFTSIAVGDKVYGGKTLSTDQIRESLGKSLHAYSSWESEAVTDQATHTKKIVDEIVSRRLLPANSGQVQQMLDVITATNNVKIFDDVASIPLDVRKRASSLFLSADSDQPIDCRGFCAKCTEILGAPVDISETKTRLLVADTGVSATLPDGLFYAPEGAAPGDLDPKSHGSFVYSEIVNSLLGPLDPKLVKVAQVAVSADPGQNPNGLSYQWSLDDLKRAIDNFAALYSTSNPLDPENPKTGPTWIINVSAGGRPQLSDALPTVMASPYLLMVSSAGNDGDFVSPTLNLFPKMNNATQNLMIVGALDQDGKSRASYSNYNNNLVDLFVRGTCVCGKPIQLNGTSQAAPIASVAAFAVAAKNPEWDAVSVKSRLIASSDITPDVTMCNFQGTARDCATGGILNLKRALDNSTQITHKVHTGATDPVHADEGIHDLSANDIDPSWVRLLELTTSMTENPVLRIHQEWCLLSLCEFKIFRKGMNPAPTTMTLQPLRITSANGSELVLPSDIEDLYLPLR